MAEEEVKQEEDIVSKAEKAAAILKAENERFEKNIKEQRELAARNLLGGQINTGIQPEKPKEETPKEYKDRIMKGGR